MSDTLHTLVQKVAGQLLSKKWTIATAESCTGGGLAYWLTALPGSSRWFDRGFVTYSNQSKCDMLGVSEHTLNMAGAVSEETAREMAEGVLKNAKTDLSIAITGIAGPGGGTTEKPVGLVFIAWGQKDKQTTVKSFIFKGDRTEIREQTLIEALQGINLLTV